jgi:hypothetical protein
MALSEFDLPPTFEPAISFLQFIEPLNHIVYCDSLSHIGPFRAWQDVALTPICSADFFGSLAHSDLSCGIGAY